MSVDRLMTQLLMTTSTEASGSGIASIRPLRNSTLAAPSLGGIAAGQLEHLVGHVQAVGEAGRADPASREQDVDPATRPEIEHGLAFLQLGHCRWIAAAEAGQDGGIGQGSPVVLGVQDLPEGRLARWGATALGRCRRLRRSIEDGPGGFGISRADLVHDWIDGCWIGRRGHRGPHSGSLLTPVNITTILIIVNIDVERYAARMTSTRSTNVDPEVRLLAALADPTRLAIVRQLASDGETCACDFTSCCDVRQPTVSHHLRVLREAGVVTSERRGQWIFYRLDASAAERLGVLARGLVPGGLIPVAELLAGRGASTKGPAANARPGALTVSDPA